jgi:hypothetical protein
VRIASVTDIEIVSQRVSPQRLMALAERSFGDLVKAVVDVEKGIMAIGGELHADEEAVLLAGGSRQASLWGINLYPAEYGVATWIEFDSMINVRPAQGNRSRGIGDAATRERIAQIVDRLVAAAP